MQETSGGMGLPDAMYMRAQNTRNALNQPDRPSDWNIYSSHMQPVINQQARRENAAKAVAISAQENHRREAERITQANTFSSQRHMGSSASSKTASTNNAFRPGATFSMIDTLPGIQSSQPPIEYSMNTWDAVSSSQSDCTFAKQHRDIHKSYPASMYNLQSNIDESYRGHQPGSDSYEGSFTNHSPSTLQYQQPLNCYQHPKDYLECPTDDQLATEDEADSTQLGNQFSYEACFPSLVLNAYSQWPLNMMAHFHLRKYEDFSEIYRQYWEMKRLNKGSEVGIRCVSAPESLGYGQVYVGLIHLSGQILVKVIWVRAKLLLRFVLLIRRCHRENRETFGSGLSRWINI
jgi:hypothetical protein